MIMNVLLFLHLAIAILLLIVILMQKTSIDGFNLSGNPNSLLAPRVVAGFLRRLTVILATLFIINSLILANLSSRKPKTVIDNDISKEKDKSYAPVAE